MVYSFSIYFVCLPTLLIDIVGKIITFLNKLLCYIHNYNCKFKHCKFTRRLTEDIEKQCNQAKHIIKSDSKYFQQREENNEFLYSDYISIASTRWLSNLCKHDVNDVLQGCLPVIYIFGVLYYIESAHCLFSFNK